MERQPYAKIQGVDGEQHGAVNFKREIIDNIALFSRGEVVLLSGVHPPSGDPDWVRPTPIRNVILAFGS